LLKLYFAQHWINHTETIQTIPLGSVEQKNKNVVFKAWNWYSRSRSWHACLAFGRSPLSNC